MKKALIGVVLGSIAYFVWGAVSWMALPWHHATVDTLPEETLVTDVLKTVVKEPGFYAFPHNMALPSATQADGKKAWEERFRSGPLGVVVFSPTGREPMDAGIFLKQYATGFVVAAIVMFALFAARKSFVSVVHRAHLAAAIGLAAGLAVHVQHRLWFSFPMGFTVVNILDLVIGFAVMGVAMAKFVPEA